MKNFLLGTVALIALGATVPAIAADLAARPYNKAPAYVAPSPIYNWTGFYIGGHVGGAFRGNDANILGGGGGGDGGRFLGGGQVGYDYQFSPNWSVKAEYLYYDLGSSNLNVAVIPGSGGGGTGYNTTIRNDGHIVRAGLNYKFGGPVVARY